MDTPELDRQIDALGSLRTTTGSRTAKAQGLNGAFVSSRKPVIVQDVASDARYLTTIGGTRGEMIQPGFDESGVVVGTIDGRAGGSGGLSLRHLTRA
jgi:putative methionine-R-sulfoxide reductase with GAF domain